MDENHQDKTESKTPATEDKLWLPPSSPKDKEKLDHRKKAKQTLIVVGISAAFVGVIVLIYTWFRFNWPLWVLISLILIGTLLLILLIRAGYTAQWTGFVDKRGWDWLQLLIQVIGAIAVPLSIIVGLYTFTTQQKEDNLRTQQQNIKSARLADAQQQETTLQTYLNDMTTLLFDDKLGGKAPTSAEAAVIARSKTIITLSRLTDPRRKVTVLDFLYESHLIGYDDSNGRPQPSIIDLSGANLSGADLSGADLSGANLSRAILSNADLSNAHLIDINLFNANLLYANLSRAILINADLRFASLYKANLPNASLLNDNLSRAILNYANLPNTILDNDDLSYAVMGYANLYKAELLNTNLYKADLSYADLSYASLYNANLPNTILTNADLSYAILRGATITQGQLDQVSICKGAILSPGLICKHNQSPT